MREEEEDLAEVMEEESPEEDIGANAGAEDKKNAAAILFGDMLSWVGVDGVNMTSVEMFVPQKEWEVPTGDNGGNCEAGGEGAALTGRR